MRKAKIALRRGVLYISALVLVAGYPTAAMATSQEPVTSSELPVTAPSESLTTENQEQGLEYTFDPATEKWNSNEWQFNTESGAYEKPPAPIVIEPEITDTSAQDQSGATSNDEETTEKTSDTTVNVNNDVKSDAVSGDANVSRNTTAGSALTGDAAVDATIINSVNSSIAAGSNQKIATFTKDVYGDVKGDIILYPMLLKAMLEAEAEESATTSISATTDFNVNNDVDLNAKSGNATVDSNTTAGDATTGSATAMANVINILNSMIATQDSFIGTINIYGSLEGDILIAPDFIPQMLSNNGGTSGSDTRLSSQDTTTIVNNITAVAESGAAAVFGNTNGGDATTGDANSNVVIFNVTGRNIVAENSMLVFVNVLGRWVGMIVDAPAGATAAMIGSDVKNNEKYAPDLTVESQSRHGITNTIAVNAASGDSTVSNNTTGGNATTGDAYAFANVANVSNSSLSLTGWFGLLFINITGDWHGSFEIDTAYGNAPEEATPQPTGPVQFVPEESRPVRNTSSNIMRTVIDSRNLRTTGSVATTVSTETQTEKATEIEQEPEVLGDMDSTNVTIEDGESNNTLFLIVAGSIVLIGASIVGVRRIF